MNRKIQNRYHIEERKSPEPGVRTFKVFKRTGEYVALLFQPQDSDPSAWCCSFLHETELSSKLKSDIYDQIQEQYYSEDYPNR